MTSTNALYLGHLEVVGALHVGPIEHPEQHEYHEHGHKHGHPDSIFERCKYMPQRDLQRVTGGYETCVSQHRRGHGRSDLELFVLLL